MQNYEIGRWDETRRAFDISDEVRAVREAEGIVEGELIFSGGVEFTIYHPTVYFYPDTSDLYRGVAADLLVAHKDYDYPRGTIASGNTQIGVYGEFANQVNADPNAQNIVFRANYTPMDEVVRPESHQGETYADYYKREFINPLGLDGNQIVIFQAFAPDPYEEAQRVDGILEANKRGFVLAGIGPDKRIIPETGEELPESDHIAFVMKGIPFHLRSHVAYPDRTTRYVNGGGKIDNFPERAMTQGPYRLVHPTQTDRVLLVGIGPGKTINLSENVLFRYPNKSNPASAVSFNPFTSIHMDFAAARLTIERIQEDQSSRAFSSIAV